MLLYKIMALQCVPFIHPLSCKRIWLNFQVFREPQEKYPGLFSLKKKGLNGVTSTPAPDLW